MSSFYTCYASNLPNWPLKLFSARAQSILSTLPIQYSHSIAFIISQKPHNCFHSSYIKSRCPCLGSSSLCNPRFFLWCPPPAFNFRSATLLILFHNYSLSKYWSWRLCFLVLILSHFGPLSTFFWINPYFLGKVHYFWLKDQKEKRGVERTVLVLKELYLIWEIKK